MFSVTPVSNVTDKDSNTILTEVLNTDAYQALAEKTENGKWCEGLLVLYGTLMELVAIIF